MKTISVLLDEMPVRVSRSHLKGLKEIGFSEIAVQANRIPEGSERPFWKARWGIDEMLQLINSCRDLEMSVSVVVEAAPDRYFISRMAHWLERVVIHGVSAVEVRLGTAWNAANVCMFRSFLEASSHLLLTVLPICRAHRIPFRASADSFSVENSSRATITPYVEKFFAEAYSTYARHGYVESVEWDDPVLGPGGLQRSALDGTFFPHVKRCICLPAWGQWWPEYEPCDAMHEAFRAALECSAEEIRYNGSSYIVGSRKNKYSKVLIKEFCELTAGMKRPDLDKALHDLSRGLEIEI